jgi:Fe-S-cluster containining protein
MIHKEGFEYGFDASKCATCGGKCCIGEKGYIWVSAKEIEAISRYINVDIERFKLDYLKKIKYKYSIKDVLINGSYECLFFDHQKGCMIYEVRPQQCRTFPFWDHVRDNLEQERVNCPGIVSL